MKDLTLEIAETRKAIESHSYEIRANKNDPKKILELQKERAPLISKLQQLQEQADKQRLENLSAKQEQTIKDELMFWVVEANDVPLQLNKDLSFEFKYPCEHTEKLTLSDLIPYTRDALYLDIKRGMLISNVRLCQKCRAERKRRLEQDHLYNAKPTPHITWKVRYRV